MAERLEEQLDRLLEAVRRNELTGPAGLVARLEGAVFAARAIAKARDGKKNRVRKRAR